MEITDNIKRLFFPCSLVGKYIRIITHKELIVALDKNRIFFAKGNDGFVVGKYGFCGITLSCRIDLQIIFRFPCVEAKPFSRCFDDQLDAAEELYGIQLHFNFNTNDVKVLIDSYRTAYSQEICNRCEALIRRQMRHYGYFIR